MKLTKRQQEILDYLKEYYAKYQSSPTHQEMADHFGLKAKSTIFKHLRALERKGLIQNDFNRNQAVRVLTQLTPRTIRSFHKIDSQNHIESLDQSELTLYPLNFDGHQFYLVDTDAFRGEGIFPGDILALALQAQYQSGDYLLMQKPDGELRIGFADFPEENIISIRLHRKGSLPEFYETAEIQVIGKIFQIYRYFK
jgi:SOS-response transcriptional repressor LexA